MKKSHENEKNHSIGLSVIMQEKMAKVLLLKFTHDKSMMLQAADIYNTIGNYHFINKNFNEAIAAYNKALSIIQNYIDPVDQQSIALIYNNIGEAYDSKGEIDQAIIYFKKALDIARTTQESTPSHSGDLGNVDLVGVDNHQDSDPNFNPDSFL